MIRRFLNMHEIGVDGRSDTDVQPSDNGAAPGTALAVDKLSEVTAYPTPKAKRLLDVTVATLSLSVLWPVWLLATALIKLDSPGPALIKQKRVGYKGRTFDFCKFRTMVEGAGDDIADRLPQGDLETSLLSPPGRNPNATRIGWVLRK
ncbi:MAG: sugar transferase, partial [Dehalococcoidia bacterium]